MSILIQNPSSEIAENVQLSVHLSEGFESFDSEFPFSIIDGDQFVFQIGNLNPLSAIQVEAYLVTSCEAQEDTPITIIAESLADNVCLNTPLRSQQLQLLPVLAYPVQNLRAHNALGHLAHTYSHDDYQYFGIELRNAFADSIQSAEVDFILSPHMDVSTMEILGMSHLYNVALSDTSVLTFSINDFNLPPSHIDLYHAHSFIKLRMKVKSDTPMGALIQNIVNVRFEGMNDLFTNLVETSIGESCGDVIYSFEDQTICDYELYEGISEAGIYQQFFNSSGDCDSLRILQINHLPSFAYYEEYKFCKGESYLGYDSDTLLTENYQTVFGCDSVFRTQLFFENIQSSQTSFIQICEGEEYQGYNVSGTYADTMLVNGLCVEQILQLEVLPVASSERCVQLCNGESFGIYTEAGSYSDTLSSVNACDSIVTTHLSFYENDDDAYFNMSICEGEEFEGYTQSGNYLLQFESVNGCDSFVTVVLRVDPSYNLTRAETICSGDEYFGFSESGTHQLEYQSVNGCDSIININLNVLPENFVQIDTSICEGLSFQGFDETGIYLRESISQNGCDSLTEINLNVFKSFDIDIDTTICAGRKVMDEGEAGEYFFSLQTINGCDSLIDLTLNVLPFNHESCEVVELYPNPAKHRMWVRVYDPDFENGKFEIYSSSGKLMEKGFLVYSLHRVDMEHFHYGTYIIKIIYGQKSYYKQFIKIKSH